MLIIKKIAQKICILIDIKIFFIIISQNKKYFFQNLACAEKN